MPGINEDLHRAWWKETWGGLKPDLDLNEWAKSKGFDSYQAFAKAANEAPPDTPRGE